MSLVCGCRVYRLLLSVAPRKLTCEVLMCSAQTGRSAFKESGQPDRVGQRRAAGRSRGFQPSLYLDILGDVCLAVRARRVDMERSGRPHAPREERPHRFAFNHNQIKSKSCSSALHRSAALFLYVPATEDHDPSDSLSTEREWTPQSSSPELGVPLFLTRLELRVLPFVAVVSSNCGLMCLWKLWAVS